MWDRAACQPRTPALGHSENEKQTSLLNEALHCELSAPWQFSSLLTKLAGQVISGKAVVKVPKVMREGHPARVYWGAVSAGQVKHALASFSTW